MQTDVLVIGGGATGGGIALDLALRGVRVILVEMGDLATGTSGRYHGLLHSGGRYAVRDPESAQECIDENRILRRIAAPSVEDTSGFFVLCPGDDPAYVEAWLAACAAVDIPTQAVPLSEARRREPALNPRLEAIYEVPDGTCDSWDLLHQIQGGAREAGAVFLTYHKIEAFHLHDGAITGAQVRNLRTDETFDIECALTINAAGPWAGDVAALAGATFAMRLSRGAMLAYNIRWVNTVINKLRLPGDGDIFVPVGTVSVIGTTSVKTTDPGDTRVEPWEVTRILDEAEAMTPGISRARILRAWGGVRPLYDPGGDQRSAKRTFTMLDHAERDGIAGLISIVGGKLTTYRLMAEKIADLACQKLSVTAASTTAANVLPALHGGANRLHRLTGRLDTLEAGENPGALVCECEIVTAPQIRESLRHGDVHTLNDLRRDLRLGMGPCQGGFCAYRAAGVCQAEQPALNAPALLREFVERRFGGMRPLMWGHNLRQAVLTEHLYGRTIGLFGSEQARQAHRVNLAERLPWENAPVERADPPPRIVIVGAGLAGLTAALTALKMGAQVEVIAQGQGALTLHPGWIEIGAVESLAQNPDHPYHTAGDALTAGLAALNDAAPLHPTAYGVTAMGRLRPVDYAVGGALPALEGQRVRVIGFRVNGDTWRDFYPNLVVQGLAAHNIEAAASLIEMPHLGGNFDDWSTDFAAFIDHDDGQRHLIAQIRPLLQPGEIAALPAVLGMEWATKARLAAALGTTILEIPVLPPSIPGLRWYHALRRAIIERGGRFTVGPRVRGLDVQGGQVRGVFAETAVPDRPRWFAGDAVILATGGVFGGGLETTYQGVVRETTAALPVMHVPPLHEWIAHDLTSGTGQPIQRAGVNIDAVMRPLRGENAAYANLYAAGKLIGGAMPVADGASEGIDIATGAAAALQAVRALSRTPEPTTGRR
ncbi:MAG: anaerobic glycerol-3-phosphate dehydrogenase subunit GlpA [bacterium]|nr:anaerobic glycerol-3-phosphate dehydrogenase subunit GlpA [bacterium]